MADSRSPTADRRRVAVLHNAISDSPTEDERDVLVQADAVVDALSALGHGVQRFACTLDLAALKHHLRETRPDVVFNLVEALDGSDRMAPVVPTLLDSLGIPYTGASALGLVLSNSKLLAKERLHTAGLATPPWVVGERGVSTPRSATGVGHTTGGLTPPARHNPEGHRLSPPYIIKAVWEHASFGMADDAVVLEAGARSVQDRLREWTVRWGRPCFAEHYVEGREFNLSVLAGKDRPEVLPPAEIDFSAFPDGKPRLVGYRAKWDAASFEYHHTPRRFDFPDADRALLERLAELACASWHLFGLRGYARVDFRVDGDGRPWVLEINSNPCLSPDAGFAAALDRAGIPFPQAVQRILDDAE
ncbi:MAG: D-alanine--D-alanine ligase [Planctomycetes bacterium]|nr:D-alanine--D-alanine ligase [Planctomycetota bacterium]